jgi:electron transfer flavoprotein alpha subunit
VDVVEEPEHAGEVNLDAVKIVCLVKQVPVPDAIEFDEETKTLKRENVPLQLNPFDRHAVQEAVRLRERQGGEVVVMTMGPPQATDALRETLALGADRCIHLSDRAFAVADTIGTSRTLALALGKEGADLVLCGRKTVDAETWQVPPEVAAYLDWPQLTNVSELEAAGRSLRARRETDQGEELYELELPAVISLARARPEAGSHGANGRIDRWTAHDLVPDLRPNDKRFGQPGSPTRVLAVRDVTPKRAGRRAGDPGEAADLVLARFAELEEPAPSWEKPGHIAEQPGRSYDCWTFVELVNGRPHRTSLELLARGRELAGKLGGRNVALVVGHDVAGAVKQAVRHGAEVVYDIDDASLADYHPELWAAALRQVLEQRRPHVLLIPATARGRDFGPRAAGALELGMTGDCVGVDIAKGGRLLQQKPAYGGNIVSVIMGSTTPQLATVRPRMYEPLEPREDVEAELQHVRLDSLPEARTRVLERTAGPESAGFELDEADVVVCVGAEAGADGVSMLDSFASDLRGVAVGGTTEVCAAGWLPHNRLIGLYGRALAPKLLVAVGVPGDYDNLSGFVKADVVVALTRDGESPMLDAADVGLVGDWRANLGPLHEHVSPHI